METIYPSDFESKIGFDRIRQQITALCITDGARRLTAEMCFSADIKRITPLQIAAEQLKAIFLGENDFPGQGYIDTAAFLDKARVIGTFLEPAEISQLRSALVLVHELTLFFNDKPDEGYSELKAMMRDVTDFPEVLAAIDRILDRFGKIRDNASPELQSIRREIADREGQVSRRLQKILREAQAAGVVDAEAQISVRDGRSVIPVTASNKKKLNGFIHDESATGKTFYVEPVEIVEINNELKELEYAERREVIRILTAFTDSIRPDIPLIRTSTEVLVAFDFLRAKVRFAITNRCGRPIAAEQCGLSLRRARHVILEQTLQREAKPIVPLDVVLTPDKHLLVISGPNAGGKSVCIKTVALVQYMYQCGLPVPAGENSELGVFDNLFMDMGDEQSIDNDLSTYSSHLLNMKTMLRGADNRSLIFIDEFGSGTEPTLGGAIAESLLEEFERRGVFGVITTHYTNLKYYASNASGVVNGAMSFDVQQIRPLFALELGKPGSSFAIEIARKSGLPEEIIARAKEKVGSEQINIEKQLREIARDKHYWESKRDRIRLAEKRIAELEERYKHDLENARDERNRLIKEARQKAEELLSGANRQIENTISEIRRTQAEKQQTRDARERFNRFKEQVLNEEESREQDIIERKIAKIREREQRRIQRKQEQGGTVAKTEITPLEIRPLAVGDKVRMSGQSSVGEVTAIKGKRITVAMGNLLTETPEERLERITGSEYKRITRARETFKPMSTPTFDVQEKRLNFSSQIDVRGMRVTEALERVREFIDEAIMLGITDLRILHGKGTGALLQEIRTYLNSVDVVESARDEHVEFGGSGITVVKLDV